MLTGYQTAPHGERRVVGDYRVQDGGPTFDRPISIQCIYDDHQALRVREQPRTETPDVAA